MNKKNVQKGIICTILVSQAGTFAVLKLNDAELHQLLLATNIAAKKKKPHSTVLTFWESVVNICYWKTKSKKDLLVEIQPLHVHGSKKQYFYFEVAKWHNFLSPEVAAGRELLAFFFSHSSLGVNSFHYVKSSSPLRWRCLRRVQTAADPGWVRESNFMSGFCFMSGVTQKNIVAHFPSINNVVSSEG